jgi:hypothetical protein
MAGYFVVTTTNTQLAYQTRAKRSVRAVFLSGTACAGYVYTNPYKLELSIFNFVEDTARAFYLFVHLLEEQDAFLLKVQQAAFG